MESDEHEDHPADTLRYMTNSFIRPTKDPNAPPPPRKKEPTRWEKLDAAYKRSQRKYDL